MQNFDIGRNTWSIQYFKYYRSNVINYYNEPNAYIHVHLDKLCIFSETTANRFKIHYSTQGIQRIAKIKYQAQDKISKQYISLHRVI
jgi:hypothetical protein